MEFNVFALLLLCVFVIVVSSVGGDPQTIHMCARFLCQYFGSERNFSFQSTTSLSSHFNGGQRGAQYFQSDAGVENGLREYILDVSGITTISIFSRVGGSR